MADRVPLHVVLGTGAVGSAVQRVLAAEGAHVRLVNRSGRTPAGEGLPDGTTVVRGDLTDMASALAACDGASVVYLCADVPQRDWPERWPQLMHGAVEGAVAARARLVFADDLYMYGPYDGPLAEERPYAAKGPKGLTRAIVANMLMEVHRSGKVQAAIARASDLYGPGVTRSFAGEQLFGQAVRGRPARVLGALDVPHTYTYVDDFARALVTLGAHEEAFGRVWHVPNDAPLTQQAFVERVFAAVGERARVQVTPRWLLRILGRVNGELRELEELLYTVERPLLVDHSRYARAFGAAVTPLDEGIRRTVEWYRSRRGSGASVAVRNTSGAA